MRRVRGAEGEIEEERAFGHQRNLVAQHGDGFVHHIFGDVVAVFRQRRRLNVVIVGGEFRVELVRLALHEAVEAIESPLQRPVVERPRRRALRHRRQVPLAGGVGAVARPAQHVRHGRRRRRQETAHVRIARVHVGNAPHPDGVVVAPGQETRPRGRAEGGGVEVDVAQAVAGQGIDVRRVDGRAVAAKVRKAGVVEHHQHDIGLAAPRRRHRPPRLGLIHRPPDPTLKRLTRRVLVAHRFPLVLATCRAYCAARR